MNIGYNRTEDPARYGAVILAAGLSSRMKDFKPLLPVDGRPAITGLAEMLGSAGIRDIVVVTGHRRELLRDEIDRLRLTEAFNEQYESGMFSSMQAGLAKAKECFPDKKGYFLVPVDVPLITIRAVRELMNAADRNEANAADRGEADCFFVPTFEGKKGHPLLVPASRLEEILQHDGTNGLKGITDKDPGKMVRVPVPDEEILLDMDTPEGYEAIQNFVTRGFKREKLEVLASRKRIIFVRHGQTQQHEEPMFIGQYDVPLAEEGRGQAKAVGEALADLIAPDVIASETWVEGISVGKEPFPPLEKIYCSDLGRAKETAEIIAGCINERYRPGGASAGGLGGFGAATGSGDFNAMSELSAMYGLGGSPSGKGLEVGVQPLQGLREISLGAWDGRPIREVREESPELYERRGEDLFTFKTGNEAENFYDMQYRAVAALRDLLADDYARNVIIVAHSGVIRALENNLKGLRVDDSWEPLEKGAYRIWTERVTEE